MKKKIAKCYQYFTPGRYEQLFFSIKTKWIIYGKKKTNDLLLNTVGKNLANRFITAQKKAWCIGVVLLGYGLL